MGRSRADIRAFVLIAWAVGFCAAVAEKEILDCRCEYPLEEVYADSLSMQMEALPHLTYDQIQDFVLDEGVLVIPQDHEACSYIQFVCDSSSARFPFWEGKCQIHPNERPIANAFVMKGMTMGMRASMTSPSKGKGAIVNREAKGGKGMMGMMMGKTVHVTIPSPPSKSKRGMGMMMGKSSSNHKVTHDLGQAYQGVHERSMNMMMKKKKGKG